MEKWLILRKPSKTHKYHKGWNESQLVLANNNSIQKTQKSSLDLGDLIQNQQRNDRRETEGVNVKDEHRREVPLPDQRRRRRRDASHHGQHRPRRPVLHSGEAVVHVPEMPLAAADPPLIQVRWGVWL